MKACTLRTALGAALASAVLLMTGCGGGGGGGSSSSSSSGSGTITPTQNPKPSVSLVLSDGNSGATTNSLTLGNPVKASATVLDENKKPIANKVVTFVASPSSLAAITPVAGTALTDSKGVASVQLAPASISAAGAGTLTATANITYQTCVIYNSDGTCRTASTSTEDFSAPIGFNVGTSSINLTGLAVGKNPLSSYGTTSVSVNVTGVPTSYPVVVNFTSICAGAGKATITASTSSVNGVATANYKDNNCASTDTITASVAGTTVATSTLLTVAAPGASSIQFVSATPETIVIKGTGSAGYQEASLVKFKVVDNNNQAIPNATVTLDLSTRTGGILLDNLATAVTKQTDANGEVQASVQSGTVPTPVWVSASVVSGGVTFSSQSVKLTISTGRPAQDRMSLAVGTHNIEGWNIDGTTTSVTARASDRVGNPVPNGTTINFISSGGQIQPSCQTTDGGCSVTFTSANPRPNLGRIAVAAYALGEESFFDANGNNAFDAGESFNDLGNLFLDNNENLVFDSATEQQIQFNASNKAACVSQLSSSPSAPSVPSTCDGAWGTAHVRQSNLIVLSGSSAYISANSFKVPGCSGSVQFSLFDENQNPLPAGTKIAITTSVISGTAVVGTTVGDSTAKGGTVHGMTIQKDLTKCDINYVIPISVTTPKGVETPFALTFTP